LKAKTTTIPVLTILPPLLAFAFFLVYLMQIKDQAFLRHLVANPLVYDDQAHRMLEGLPRGQPFFLSPLYPAFVALVYAIAGSSRLVLLFAQGALLAVNVGLLGAACSKILSRRATILAMLGMVFYWSFYYFAGEILPTTLCLTFMLAGWLLFVDRDARSLHPVATGSLAFAGVLTIVYALPALKHLGSLLDGRSLPAPPNAYWGTLSVFLVFVPASILLLSLVHRRRLKPNVNLLASGLLMGFSILIWSGVSLVAGFFALSLLGERRGRPVRILVFALGLAVPVAASMTHNYLISGDLIPVTSSFGVNFFIGNNPASDGMDPFKLGEADAVRIEADRQALAGADRSDFFRKQATSFIGKHPGRWLSLLGTKALVSVSRFGIDNNADISERRDAWTRLFLPLLHFGLVFPLGIAGIRYCLRDRPQAYTLVLGFTGAMAVGLMFFVAERFRLTATVFLIPLAACGLVGLYGDVLARRLGSFAVGIMLVAGGAVVSNVDFLGLSDLEFASIIVNKGHVARLSGDLATARRLVGRALRKEPQNAGAYFQLGAIEEAEGNQPAAMSYYLDTLDRDPFFYAAYANATKLLEANRISLSYIDRYVQSVLADEPHDQLHQDLVEYIMARTQSD
jgi:hypothetical protein